MKQEIKLSGSLSLTLDNNQKKELLEQLTNSDNNKELVKQEILGMLEKHISNVRFLDKNCDVSNYPTSRFEILNNKCEWLFDIDYDSKNQHFWYSDYRIFDFFSNKYSINYNDIQEVMKSILVEHLNLKGVTPQNWQLPPILLLVGHLNLKGVTPYSDF